MTTTTLDPLAMFSIGIGPSSSHTVGPMKAGLRFVQFLIQNNILTQVIKLKIQLYGSLALTGEGHGTCLALLNGLSGHEPKTITTAEFFATVESIIQQQKINLGSKWEIDFAYQTPNKDSSTEKIKNDICLEKSQFLTEHANGMILTGYDAMGQILLSRKYFSIGGGFVLDHDEINQIKSIKNKINLIKLPYPFNTAKELFTHCINHKLSIAQLVSANMLVKRSLVEIRTTTLEIATQMELCLKRGIINEGILPGGLKVKRRAPQLYRKLMSIDANFVDFKNQRLLAMIYAIAVNEENAAFGKVVTAPTNGAAGTIPGVLQYYKEFIPDCNEDKIIEFILTAGAIGMLYKYNASISAAEVGCQGEIGVACSMAAGALAAVLGGSLIQIEKAAEIAMEHSLGMTCDPIAGLVQIPCIERNGIAAAKAIDIVHLVLLEEEAGKISLDQVIKTMMETGRDMSSKYKETALGGLAVNFVNC